MTTTTTATTATETVAPFNPEVNEYDALAVWMTTAPAEAVWAVQDAETLLGEIRAVRTVIPGIRVVTAKRLLRTLNY